MPCFEGCTFLRFVSRKKTAQHGVLICSSLRYRKDAHLSDAHPYAPFPIARLEEAVSGVPQEAFSPEEIELTRFGQSHSFTW